MQRNPFERIERMFEEAGEEFPQFGLGVGERGRGAVDVAERDSEFVVTCELPGFDKDDIDLRVTDSTLHIHAEYTTEEEVEEEAGEYIHRERRRADISRSIPLPEDFDEDEVSATYEDGVLTVTLPKRHAEEETAHKVPIS